MKSVLILLAVLCLSACDNTVEPKITNMTDDYKLPVELSDCRVYLLHNKYSTAITVVRCGNNVTTQLGTKFKQTTTLIEE